jgi:Protein of unknown function (DUF2846)
MNIRNIAAVCAGLLCAALIGGCATVAHGPTFAEAKAAPAPSGMATVYVFRKYAEPTAWGASIHIDEREIATLNQGGFTWAYVAPGRHTIRGVWSGMSGQKDSVIGIDVEADRTYYVELTGTSRLAGTGVSTTPGTMSLRFQVGSGLNEVSPGAGAAIVSECCRLQKAR